MQLSMSVALCKISLYPKRRIRYLPNSRFPKIADGYNLQASLVELNNFVLPVVGGNFFSGGVTEAKHISCRCGNISRKVAHVSLCKLQRPQLSILRGPLLSTWHLDENTIKSWESPHWLVIRHTPTYLCEHPSSSCRNETSQARLHSFELEIEVPTHHFEEIFVSDGENCWNIWHHGDHGDEETRVEKCGRVKTSPRCGICNCTEQSDGRPQDEVDRHECRERAASGGSGSYHRWEVCSLRGWRSPRVLHHYPSRASSPQSRREGESYERQGCCHRYIINYL